jgi:hypothetical protein
MQVGSFDALAALRHPVIHRLPLADIKNSHNWSLPHQDDPVSLRNGTNAILLDSIVHGAGTGRLFVTIVTEPAPLSLANLNFAWVNVFLPTSLWYARERTRILISDLTHKTFRCSVKRCVRITQRLLA